MRAMISASLATAGAGMLAGAEIFVSLCLLPSFVAVPSSSSSTSVKLALFNKIYHNALPFLPPITILTSLAFGTAWFYGGGNLAIVGGVSSFSVGIYTTARVAPVNDKLLGLSRKDTSLTDREVKNAENSFKLWSRMNWVRAGLSVVATSAGVALLLQLSKL